MSKFEKLPRQIFQNIATSFGGLDVEYKTQGLSRRARDILESDPLFHIRQDFHKWVRNKNIQRGKILNECKKYSIYNEDDEGDEYHSPCTSASPRIGSSKNWRFYEDDEDSKRQTAFTGLREEKKDNFLCIDDFYTCKPRLTAWGSEWNYARGVKAAYMLGGKTSYALFSPETKYTGAISKFSNLHTAESFLSLLPEIDSKLVKLEHNSDMELPWVVYWSDSN